MSDKYECLNESIKTFLPLIARDIITMTMVSYPARREFPISFYSLAYAIGATCDMFAEVTEPELETLQTIFRAIADMIANEITVELQDGSVIVFSAEEVPTLHLLARIVRVGEGVKA